MDQYGECYGLSNPGFESQYGQDILYFVSAQPDVAPT